MIYTLAGRPLEACLTALPTMYDPDQHATEAQKLWELDHRIMVTLAQTKDVIKAGCFTFYCSHCISGHGILLLFSPTLGILGHPLHQGVMHQGLQNTQQSVPVRPQDLHRTRWPTLIMTAFGVMCKPLHLCAVC